MPLYSLCSVQRDITFTPHLLTVMRYRRPQHNALLIKIAALEPDHRGVTGLTHRVYLSRQLSSCTRAGDEYSRSGLSKGSVAPNTIAFAIDHRAKTRDGLTCLSPSRCNDYSRSQFTLAAMPSSVALCLSTLYFLRHILGYANFLHLEKKLKIESSLSPVKWVMLFSDDLG